MHPSSGDPCCKPQGALPRVEPMRYLRAATCKLTDPWEIDLPLSDPQNIYDRPEFFAGYSQMERFGEGWTRALEQPMFLEVLPDVTGLRVLDLGCGAGQLSLHLAQV